MNTLKGALQKIRRFAIARSFSWELPENNHLSAENITLKVLEDVAAFAIRRASRRCLIMPLLACCSSLYADVITFETLPDAYFFNAGDQNVGSFYSGIMFGPNVAGPNVSRFGGYDDSGSAPHSGDVVIWDATDPTITIGFASSVQSFGVSYASLAPLTLEAFDPSAVSATLVASTKGRRGLCLSSDVARCAVPLLLLFASATTRAQPILQCLVGPSPGGASLEALRGAGAFTVVVAGSVPGPCGPWLAAGGVSWIIASRARTGTGAVTYSVLPTSQPIPRTGTVTVSVASSPESPFTDSFEESGLLQWWTPKLNITAAVSLRFGRG